MFLIFLRKYTLRYMRPCLSVYIIKYNIITFQEVFGSFLNKYANKIYDIQKLNLH